MGILWATHTRCDTECAGTMSEYVRCSACCNTEDDQRYTDHMAVRVLRVGSGEVLSERPHHFRDGNYTMTVEHKVLSKGDVSAALNPYELLETAIK